MNDFSIKDTAVDQAIQKYELPTAWPDAALAELKGLTAGGFSPQHEQPGSRRDIRSLPLVTIDDEDARDFDDAVYCEPMASGWRLVVAVADVGHYIRAGGALDAAALERGNSVYFPYRVIPMLPEEISNGVCSLNPGEDRYCVACEVDLDNQGAVSSYRFYTAIMHSHARLTYTGVDQIIEQRSSDTSAGQPPLTPELTTRIHGLHQLSQLLYRQRVAAGAIEFEFPEPQLRFDHNHRIEQITAKPRGPATRLIEECMLTANVCAGKFLQRHFAGRAIYRNHAGPNVDSLADIRRILSSLDLRLAGGDAPRAADYSALLAQQRGAEDGRFELLQAVLLRSLGQAEYACQPDGHFALSLPFYTHFTSPIRRYPDLIAHRLIRSILHPDNASNPPHWAAADALNKAASHCNLTERRANEAAWSVIAMLKAEFMQGKLGQTFDARISGVREFGLFVTLQDILVDGLVHVSELGDDYFHFDPHELLLSGRRSGQRYRLGDPLQVRVKSVDPEQSKISFVPASQPKTSGRAGRPGKKSSSIYNRSRDDRRHGRKQTKTKRR